MQVVVTAVQVVAKRLSVRWKLRTRWAVDAPMLTLGTADVASVGRQWCSVGCVTVVRRGTAGRHWLSRHSAKSAFALGGISSGAHVRQDFRDVV